MYSFANKTIVAGILLALAVLTTRCSEGGGQDSAATVDTTSCAAPLNPNGDSELAMLMREMMSSAQNVRELVRSGQVPETFPEAFLRIHTAKPTDSETKKASFESHATNYVLNLRELYQSDPSQLTKNYNAMVSSCASCHSEHCPGPLKAIEKLKI